MHCAPQPKGNDSPKVSEAGKNSKSTTYPQQDKVTSLEVAKVNYFPISPNCSIEFG